MTIYSLIYEATNYINYFVTVDMITGKILYSELTTFSNDISSIMR